MNTLDWRWLIRNGRLPEIHIMFWALTLAVAVVSAIALFGSRLEQSLTRESHAYLAADRVVSSRHPIPEDWKTTELLAPLQQGMVMELASMAMFGDDMQLAAIKAVSKEYPLRGELWVSDTAFATDDASTLAEGIPEVGTVWVDSQLLPLLNAEVGDAIEIGESRLTIAKVVIKEPDARSRFAMMGPRVLMNQQDLAATELILDGSRIRYRWLLAGEESDLTALGDWLKDRLGEHYRWRSVASEQSNLGSALKQGRTFLLLAAMIGVLLAAVAISLASAQFARRQVDAIALLKSLGANAKRVRTLLFFQLIVLTLLATLLGTGLAECFQRIIAWSLVDALPKEFLLPNPSVYLLGIFTGSACLLGFVLPPLWRLPQVPPLKILRQSLPMDELSPWLRGGIGVVVALLLVAIFSQSLTMTLVFSAGVALVIAFSALSGRGFIAFLRRFKPNLTPSWRLATAALARKGSGSVMQMVVYASALLLLLVLFGIKHHLVDDWRVQVPDDAPNHFFLNIPPDQKDGFLTDIESREWVSSPLYPMILGRLQSKNGEAFDKTLKESNPALRREVNLSWAAQMGDDNQLVKGQWWEKWKKSAHVGVSVEADVARQLQLELGDILRFSLAGMTLTAEVASVRQVDWDSMRPNFFFLFEAGALDEFAPTYMTSVFIPPEQKSQLSELLKHFPTTVVIEMDRIIERVQRVIQQISQALSLVLWIVMACGVLVLYAAVTASLHWRQQEMSLLRALGCSGHLLRQSLWLEFSLLGLLSGLLATIGGELVLTMLQTQLFDGTPSIHGDLWLIAPVAGAIAIGCLGVFSCRHVLAHTPLRVLRANAG